MLGHKHRPSRQAAAVVTGAASGIGLAFAKEIVRRGGRVMCVDVNPETLDQAITELEDIAAGQAISYLCDVRKSDQVEELSQVAETRLGRPVSLLINNAGVWVGGEIGEVSLMDWRWCLDVNLWGVIHGCHYFVPKFKAQGCGGIINVASVAGYAAVPSFTAYNVSKTAVVALSETLAAELAGQGVQVTVLCPTAVKTNIIENGNLPQGTGSFASSIMSKWVFSETADAVAKQTLDALDRKKLYVMPQMDSRLVWRLKRFAPRLYEKALGEVYRLSTD